MRGPSLQNAAPNQRKQEYERYHSNCRGHRADVRLQLALADRPNDPTPTDAIDSMNSFPPLPPFTEETARQKVQAAEAAWNTRIPERVALAYTEDSEWRNRAEFVNGRPAIIELLRRKWARELDYRLRKELWAFTSNR